MVQRQAGRQNDEQSRDQQDAEILLELHDVAHGHVVLARQRGAHHGDGEQAGLVLDPVGRGEHDHHQGQRNGALQVIGNPVPLEQQHDDPCPGEPQQSTGDCGLEYPQPGRRSALLESADDDRLEHEHAEDRSDGVVHDPFPLDRRAHARVGPDVPQQWDDHGGTGHHENRAEQDGDLQLEAGQQVGKRRRQHPGDRHPDQHQVPEHSADVGELGDVEAQPALEQNHRYREGDDREQHVAEQGLGVQEPEHRPCHESHHQQEQDRRQPQAPRQPLGADTQDYDARQPDQEIVHRSSAMVIGVGRTRYVPVGFATAAVAAGIRRRPRRTRGRT